MRPVQNEKKNNHGPHLLRNRSPLSKADIDGFCKTFSPSNWRAVTDTVEEITRLRTQIVLNILAIGEGLIKLRSAVDSEKFSQFMTLILPTLGISRSSGYRWMGLAEKLVQIFPDPVVREQLMLLTDGRGIISNSRDECNRDFTRTGLTKAAETALKGMPPQPATLQERTHSEAWVRQFLHATAKARAVDRAPSRNVAKDRQEFVRRFLRFARDYGPSAAENLCGDLDKTLNRIVETNRTVHLESSQSQVRTRSRRTSTTVPQRQRGYER